MLSLFAGSVKGRKKKLPAGAVPIFSSSSGSGLFDDDEEEEEEEDEEEKEEEEKDNKDDKFKIGTTTSRVLPGHIVTNLQV